MWKWKTIIILKVFTDEVDPRKKDSFTGVMTYAKCLQVDCEQLLNQTPKPVKCYCNLELLVIDRPYLCAQYLLHIFILLLDSILKRSLKDEHYDYLPFTNKASEARRFETCFRLLPVSGRGLNRQLLKVQALLPQANGNNNRLWIMLCEILIKGWSECGRGVREESLRAIHLVPTFESKKQ